MTAELPILTTKFVQRGDQSNELYSYIPIVFCKPRAASQNVEYEYYVVTQNLSNLVGFEVLLRASQARSAWTNAPLAEKEWLSIMKALEFFVGNLGPGERFHEIVQQVRGRYTITADIEFVQDKGFDHVYTLNIDEPVTAEHWPVLPFNLLNVMKRYVKTDNLKLIVVDVMNIVPLSPFHAPSTTPS